MRAGDCFFNQATAGVPSHPWVIISDPDLDCDNVVIVNFTDADSHHDPTCIFTPNEISWLTKRSCLAYQYAKLTSVASLESARSRGLLFNYQTVTREVLERIREGAATSEETRNDCLKFLRSQGLA